MMRKYIFLFAAVCLLALPAFSQQQWVGTGQINGKDAQVYVYVCKVASATAPLPIPAPICKQDSADLATIYTTSGLSSSITQPLSIAAGAQGTWWVASGAGAYRMSTCTAAGIAATGSSDQVDPIGCSTVYVSPNCTAVATTTSGQSLCGTPPTSLPTVPGTGFNTLNSDSGGAAAWVVGRPKAFHLHQSSATSLTTSVTTLAVLQLPAYAVQYGGSLLVSGYCSYAVASGMTASTFTTYLATNDGATGTGTHSSTLLQGTTASVAAAGSLTVAFGDVHIQAPASGLGFNTSGGYIATQTPSILGVNKVSLSGDTISGFANSSTGTSIIVNAATSVANSTANTGQCNIDAIFIPQ